MSSSYSSTISVGSCHTCDGSTSGQGRAYANLACFSDCAGRVLSAPGFLMAGGAGVASVCVAAGVGRPSLVWGLAALSALAGGASSAQAGPCSAQRCVSACTAAGTAGTKLAGADFGSGPSFCACWLASSRCDERAEVLDPDCSRVESSEVLAPSCTVPGGSARQTRQLPRHWRLLARQHGQLCPQLPKWVCQCQPGGCIVTNQRE